MSFALSTQVGHPPASIHGPVDSSLGALTGESSGPPLRCPVDLAAVVDDALDHLRQLSPRFRRRGTDLSGSVLLTERARLNAYRRQGRSSPGGACRLLPTRERWLAINLPRASDWDLMPAWLGCEIAVGDWGKLEQVLRTQHHAPLIETARLLGLAVALCPDSAADCPNEIDARQFARQRDAIDARPLLRRDRPPRVLDLSSLWAGPLCGSLLQRCGADVVKLESVDRPDGARSGNAAFYALMNAGKQCVALDFSSREGLRRLIGLIEHADIVIEGSRPRALRQLGVEAESVIRRSGGTWVSITGYGRRAPQEDWVAFGDDAGVAAGLSCLLREHHGLNAPVFVGDAIADPLTGVHAALLAWSCWCRGGDHLIDLALASTVRHCMEAAPPPSERTVHLSQTVRGPSGRVAPLGAGIDAVLNDWGLAC